MSSAQDFSQLAPYCTDAHSARPYFLLPIPIVARTDDEAIAQAENDPSYQEALQGLKNSIGDAGPFTDIYVLSHGWHRNYYGAIASYDRLVTRMMRLFMRGRLPQPNLYKPLFLCLHWSSEIGKDTWTDLSGRRDKQSFLDIAKERFQPTADLQNLLEDAFEFFAAVSAPDTTFDDHLHGTSKELFDRFQATKLAEETGNEKIDPLPLRIAAAWACYHESVAKGVRGVQAVPAQDFARFGLRLSLLVKFVIAAVGVGVILGLPVFRKAVMWLGGEFGQGFHSLKDQVPADGWLAVPIAVLAAYAIAFLCTAIGFYGALGASKILKRTKMKTDVGWVTGIFWILHLLVRAIPLVLLLSVEYLFSARPFRRWLFSERRNKQNKPRFSLNYAFAQCVRAPNGALEEVAAPQSIWATVMRVVDSQLAFFQMQRRGVMSARIAADAISDVCASTKDLRLHLVGHSFGGLLVVNVARELARQAAPVAVETVCTVEGAYASGWFGIELPTIKNVRRTIASIFSEADTATGFYYPAANAARMAAGSVGFSSVPNLSSAGTLAEQSDAVPCERGCRINHVHRPRAYASLADPPVLPGAPEGLSVMNIDASKIIYEGPPASGGGHTDIYKDDVVHLLWAVLHRPVMIAKYPPPADDKKVSVQPEEQPVTLSVG